MISVPLRCEHVWVICEEIPERYVLYRHLLPLLHTHARTNTHERTHKTHTLTCQHIVGIDEGLNLKVSLSKRTKKHSVWSSRHDAFDEYSIKGTSVDLVAELKHDIGQLNLMNRDKMKGTFTEHELCLRENMTETSVCVFVCVWANTHFGWVGFREFLVNDPRHIRYCVGCSKNQGQYCCGKNQGVAAVKFAVKIKVKVARSQSQQKNRIFKILKQK
jgi:hypothetical protein